MGPRSRSDEARSVLAGGAYLRPWGLAARQPRWEPPAAGRSRSAVRRARRQRRALPRPLVSGQGSLALPRPSVQSASSTPWGPGPRAAASTPAGGGSGEMERSAADSTAAGATGPHHSSGEGQGPGRRNPRTAACLALSGVNCWDPMSFYWNQKWLVFYRSTAAWPSVTRSSRPVL